MYHVSICIIFHLISYNHFYKTVYMICGYYWIFFETFYMYIIFSLKRIIYWFIALKFQRFFPSFICTICKYFPFRVHQYTVNQLFFVTTLFRNLLPKNWFAMKPYSRQQGSYEPREISCMWFKVDLQYIYIY